MALNQTNKLVWIVETIYKARKISFEDLNRKWMDNTDLSGGLEMQKRTFHKWKWNIFDTFGLIIECEKSAPYRYYIENADDVKGNSIEQWLINTYSVSNSLMESKAIKERIILEDVPSGQSYLEPILEAMRQNHMIHITYHNYWRNDDREHYLMPLCVKLFRQRWYLVGRTWPSEHTAIFSLDRIKAFRKSSHTFEYPEDFYPDLFFEGCFGIINNTDTKIEQVRLKVSASQANYFRDLPLHESQQEVEHDAAYSIFTIDVKPAYDFVQEILRYGDEVEVLEPAWLRNEIKTKIERMMSKYK